MATETEVETEDGNRIVLVNGMVMSVTDKDNNTVRFDAEGNVIGISNQTPDNKKTEDIPLDSRNGEKLKMKALDIIRNARETRLIPEAPKATLSQEVRFQKIVSDAELDKAKRELTTSAGKTEETAQISPRQNDFTQIISINQKQNDRA